MLAEAQGRGAHAYLGRGRHLYLAINIDTYLATGTAGNRWYGNAGTANGYDPSG